MGIGKRIKDYRLAKGWGTGTQFAEIIGISQGSLSDLENEKTSPAAETLQKIIRHTDINPKWLLVGEGPMLLEQPEVYPLGGGGEGRVFEVSGLTEKERKIIELLRGNPGWEDRCLKLLGGGQAAKEIFEEFQRFLEPEPTKT